MDNLFNCLICGVEWSSLATLSNHVITCHVKDEHINTALNFLQGLQHAILDSQQKTDDSLQTVGCNGPGDIPETIVECLPVAETECESINIPMNNGKMLLANRHDRRGVGRKYKKGRKLQKPPTARSRLSIQQGENIIEEIQGDERMTSDGSHDNVSDGAIDRRENHHGDAEDISGRDNLAAEKRNNHASVDTGYSKTPTQDLQNVIQTEDILCQVQGHFELEGSSNNQQDTEHTNTCTLCGLVFRSKSEYELHECCRSTIPQTPQIRTSKRIRLRKLQKEQEKEQLSTMAASFNANMEVDNHSGKQDLMEKQEENRLRKCTERYDGPCFVCKICSKKFGCKVSLKEHEAGHETNNMQCPLCEKQFTHKYHLSSHIRHAHPKKTKTQIFRCSQCEHVVFSRNGLKRHQALHHQNGRAFKCTYDKCDSAFGLKDDLLRHIATVHDPSKHKYKCEFCGRTFLHKTKFEIHRYSHDKTLSPHVCQQCNKGFSTRDALLGHTATIHENKRPFQCVHCGKAYSKKYALDQHARKHTGEKVSKCTLCDEMFVSCTERRQHLKEVHQVGFTCHQCGILFVSQYKHDQHFQKHHVNQKSWTCNICKKKLPTNDELQYHTRMCHRVLSQSVNSIANSNSNVTDMDTILVNEAEKVIGENENIQIVETPLVAMQPGNQTEGEQVIYIDSSELDSSLQTDGETMIVYFCPTGDIATRTESDEAVETVISNATATQHDAVLSTQGLE